MDLERVKNLRLLLTAHFAVIAWLAAVLVASGSGSLLLPVLIFFCTIIAILFVDLLEKFSLGSITSALAMSLATAIAVGQYVYSALNESEQGQLMAVAGLLVYPEAVLFLQRKSLRVFEQLAVFLLLEMIVAALVNDDILFGMMLAPIMLLWVSSLFLFSRYATLVKIDPSIETPLPKLAEILFRRFWHRVIGDNKATPMVESRFEASKDVQSSRSIRRTLQSIPIGVGALVFAGLFFYLVPRVNSSSFGSAFGTTATPGLPDRLTFGKIGRLLQDPSPVMRVEFFDRLSRQKLTPKTPPYLRARIFDGYGPSGRARRGQWTFGNSLSPKRLGQTRFRMRGISSYPTQLGLSEAQLLIASQGSLREEDEIARLENYNRKPVRVSFNIRPEFGEEMFTIPPIFATAAKQQLQLNHDSRYMLLQKRDKTGARQNKSLGYEVLSSGFINQQQSAVTPAVLAYSLEDIDDSYFSANSRLTRGFSSLRKADEYRRQFIQEERLDASNKVALALAIERHLAFSGEFGYTLDLRPPADTDLDPVEDFLINQRVGHCQYFATAMVCLLRQSQIPSRLVIGYRPTEFNGLGEYFTVRQSDAHAWVEALFTHEQLKNTIFRNELTDNAYYWVRFDPTPPPDGELEVIQQDGQAIDYAEKLWQEYVVEGQNLASDSGFYDPASESERSYAAMLTRVREFFSDLQSGKIISEVGFAWPAAILIIVIGGALLVIWQVVLWLPKLAPQLASRLGIARSDRYLQHPFYARCMNLLSKLGYQRDASETPAEYVQTAEKLLRQRGQSAANATGFLTELYYRLRFGKQQTIAPEEQARIRQEISQIEDAVRAAKKSSG